MSGQKDTSNAELLHTNAKLLLEIYFLLNFINYKVKNQYKGKESYGKANKQLKANYE